MAEWLEVQDKCLQPAPPREETRLRAPRSGPFGEEVWIRRVGWPAGRTLRVGVSGGAAPTCISVQAFARLAKEGTESPLLSDDAEPRDSDALGGEGWGRHQREKTLIGVDRVRGAEVPQAPSSAYFRAAACLGVLLCTFARNSPSPRQWPGWNWPDPLQMG